VYVYLPRMVPSFMYGLSLLVKSNETICTCGDCNYTVDQIQNRPESMTSDSPLIWYIISVKPDYRA
jgi:hypothetical protein